MRRRGCFTNSSAVVTPELKIGMLLDDVAPRVSHELTKRYATMHRCDVDLIVVIESELPADSQPLVQPRTCHCRHCSSHEWLPKSLWKCLGIMSAQHFCK